MEKVKIISKLGNTSEAPLNYLKGGLPGEADVNKALEEIAEQGGTVHSVTPVQRTGIITTGSGDDSTYELGKNCCLGTFYDVLIYYSLNH